MKIIQERQPLQIVCVNCNSLYEVSEGDVTAVVDMISGQINHGAPDFRADWKCPVCKGSAGRWLYELPAEWREPIKQRGEPELSTKMHNDMQVRLENPK